jgi:hypothetical protein
MSVQLLNIFVPAATLAWQQGLTIYPGDTLRVRCNNSVKYANTPLYAQPEGHYADDTSPTHAFDPDNCIVYSGGTAPTFPVSNTFPASLAMVAVPAGAGSPTLAGDLDGYRPERDTTFTYAALAADLEISDGSPIATYFIFNDTLTGFGNNSLSFLVTLTRYAQGASTLLNYSLLRAQMAPLSIAAPETPVDADRLPISVKKFNPDPQLVADVLKVAGSFGNRGRIPGSKWWNWDFDWMADYIESPWWFSGCWCTPIAIDGNASRTWEGVVLPTGSSVYIYRPQRRKTNVWQPFGWAVGVEAVDTGDSIIFNSTRGEVSGLSLNTKRSGSEGDISGSVTGFMRTPTSYDLGNSFKGQNSVWTITFVGSPAGGHTTVTNENGESFQIQFDDTAGEAQTAAEAVYGVGNITVGKSGAVYTLTGAGDNLGVNLPLPTIVDAFTGGTSPHTTFAEVTKGGPKEYPIVPFRSVEATVWLGDTRADLYTVDGDGVPTGVVSDDEFETNAAFTGMRDKVHTENRKYPSYRTSIEKGTDDGRTEQFTLRMGLTQTAFDLFSKWEAGDKIFMGLQFLSNEEVIAASSVFFEFRSTQKVSIVKMGPFTNNQGVWTVEIVLEVCDDVDYGGFGQEVIFLTKTNSQGYAVA